MKLEILQTEMISAMKNKDKIRKEALSNAIALIKKVAFDKGCNDNINDALVDEVLLKEVKSIQEQIDTCPKDRVETLNEYRAKLSVIQEFAPQIITDANEIEKIITNLLIVNSINPTRENKGIVMKTVMPALKGKVDMAIANRILNEMLN